MRRCAAILALIIAASPLGAYELDPDGTFRTRVLPVAEAVAAPETVIDTPRGETSIGAHAGTVRIVMFWSTWCEVCEVEMPLLAEAARRYPERDVVVMPVSVDDSPAMELVAAHLEARGLDLPVMHDRGFALAGRVGVTGTPTTIFVDRYEQVVAAFQGQTPWRDPALHDWLEALLAAKDAETSRSLLADID